MFRLRSRILTHLLSLPSISSPIPFPLHRLLSAASPAVSPNPSFVVEDYLVGTSGLTPAQAFKVYTKLSHLKSPNKPDAVLAFLAGLGLSSAAVAKEPQLLCARDERTLTPNVAELTSLGLSRSEVAPLVPVAPVTFRRRSALSNLPYYLSLFGCYEKLHRILKKNSGLLTSSLENVVKPNVAFLQECGIDAFGIASLSLAVPWLLGSKPEQVREMAVRVEALGVPRGSLMFRHALHAVAFLSKEKIATKVEYLKKTFRWSDAEVGIAVSKLPMVLALSKDVLHSKSEFLISHVDLEPAYIANRPALISYSLEGRLRPRYYVVKFLKEKGLLKRDLTYFIVVKVTEKVFVEKCISPRNETAPYLAEDYATACRGEVPPRFIFA